MLSVELQSGNLVFAVLFALFCDFVFGLFYPLLMKYVPRHGREKNAHDHTHKSILVTTQRNLRSTRSKASNEQGKETTEFFGGIGLLPQSPSPRCGTKESPRLD